MNPRASSDPPARRRAAEARLQEQTADRPPPDETDLRRLQHELEVHQIELEMQNEELQAALAANAATLERYTDLYDFAPVGYLTLERAGTILAANLTVARLLGLDRSCLLGRRLAQYLAEGDRRAFHDFLETTFTSSRREGWEVAIPQTGAAPRQVRFEAVVAEDGQACRAAVLDVTERHRAEAERARLIVELTHTHSEVKVLSGLLPICGYCKKIRDGNNCWQSIERHIVTHTNAQFTHTVCPECERQIVQPELDALLHQAGLKP